MEMTVEQQRALAMARARARASGDVAAARALASEYARMQSATPADPIKAQVSKELADLKAQGVPVGDGLARQFLQGATFGAADEVLAGLSTPLEMIKRGTFSPTEGYNYAKAREDALLEGARKEGGLTGTAMEMAAGFATGGALAKGGLTFVKEGAGALRNAGNLAKDAAIFGGLTGFNESSGMDRFSNAATGAAVGGAAGGAVGLAAPVVSATARNTLGWASAMRDPEKYAGRQLARALSESGRTPQQVAGEVADATAMGQPFTLADALGNPGQRMLSTVTRNPGAGRTQAVEFLDARQAGQGRRISNAVAEALGAKQTAKQADATMRAARAADADLNYGASRGSAGAVDVSRAISQADDILQPGATRLMSPQSNIADNSIESAVRRARAYLTDGKSVLSDFDQGLMAKRELDAMIESASPTVQRSLIPIRNAVDEALAKASKPYALARDTFRNQSRAIDAIEEGRAAARSGRFEDTTRRFAEISDPERQGYRIGYGNNIIEGVQVGAVGQNKARVFTSDALQNELDALSLYQGPRRPGERDMLAKALGRENTMFETRATAMGGSKTADNLADDAAMGVNPEVIANILSGNFLAAGRNVIGRSSANLSGNTAPVREKLAQALLQTAPNAAALEQSLSSIVKDQTTRESLIRALLSGATAGGATGVGSVQGRPTR